MKVGIAFLFKHDEMRLNTSSDLSDIDQELLFSSHTHRDASFRPVTSFIRESSKRSTTQITEKTLKSSERKPELFIIKIHGVSIVFVLQLMQISPSAR